MDANTPVLIGCGQIVQRDGDPVLSADPVGLMKRAAELAAADANLAERALATLDSIAVVNVIGWQYQNPPGLLAEQLGARPRRALYTAVGGNTPQWLVNRTADEIAAGTTRLALIAGAEAIDSAVRARKLGVPLPWSKGGEGTCERVGDERIGSSNSEMQHGMMLPTSVYPLFENALRAHHGWSIAEHRRRLGELCARMAAVAAANPNAWFREQRSADLIATVSADNRMISFPYPKYMNAIMNVDQGAALLMTSVATARELGVPESRWVYLHGAADAHDVWFPSERVNFYSSPAIRRIGSEALRMAGVTIADIDHFDLYSCFPVAVQIARDELGMALDDPRELTATGGLPYHGGPGNNYATHGIAEIMKRVRAEPGSWGLATGLGWYITKHAIGIYSCVPPERPWSPVDGAGIQAELDALPHPRVLEHAEGEAEIETYTVVYDRQGSPARGIVIAKLASGERVIANTPEDRELLEQLTEHEAIGRRGRLSQQAGTNRFEPS